MSQSAPEERADANRAPSPAKPFQAFASEAESAAATLLKYSECYAAKGLADIALGSASLVEASVSSMDSNCRSVLSLLKEENKFLREEMMKLVQHSAESVSAAVNQSSGPHLATNEQARVWTMPAGLAEGEALAVSQLCDVVQRLTDENGSLHAQLVELQTKTVPVDVARTLEDCISTLNAQLTNTKADLETALVRLEDACRAPHPAASTDNEEVMFAPGTAASVHLPSPSFLQRKDEPMWADAIRELEEQATLAANQRRDRAYVDDMEGVIAQHQSQCDALQAELATSSKLMESMQRDYDVLKAQHGALMGEFVSLLQVTQQLATQYQLVAPRESSGRTVDSTISKGALDIPLAPVKEGDAPRSLLPLHRFSNVVESSLLGGAVDATPYNAAGDATGFNASSAARHNSFVGQSPAPHNPLGSTYRKFSKTDIAASVGKHSIASIEDLVKKNQRLLGENAELELELADLRERVREMEVRLPPPSPRKQNEIHSTSADGKQSKRSRVDDFGERTQPVTADAACMTDAAAELIFWHEKANHDVAYNLSLPEELQRPRSYNVEGDAASLKRDGTDWSLLAMLSDAHHALVESANERLALMTGEHMRNSTDALLRSTVEFASRALRAEQEGALAKEAYAEVLQDMEVRDALNPQHLTIVAELLERALSHRTTHSATSRSLVAVPTDTNAAGAAVGSESGGYTTADITLWNSLLQLLQSATSKDLLLSQLVRESPLRTQMTQLLTAPVSDVDAKLRESESVVSELRAQLEYERGRAASQVDALHREKLRHVATLERMWQAEQQAAEAAAALTAMQHSSDRMYTAEQYNVLQEDLQTSHRATVETQLLLDEERGRIAVLEEQLSAATAQHAQEQEEQHGAIAQLQIALNDAKASASLHHRRQRDMESELLNARHAAASHAERLLDMQDTLQYHQNLVEELKQALLSQTCTETLLFTLFPGETSLSAIVARGRSLNEENIALKEKIAAGDIQLASLANNIESLTATLRSAQDERQQVQVQLNSIQAAAATDEATAINERNRLQIELEASSHHVATLLHEREQLRQREKVLEERVEVLAADPISFNVRKYGVERTKTLQEQMELLHERSEALQSALTVMTAERDARQTDVQQLQGQLDRQVEKSNGLAASVTAQESSLATKAAHVKELETDVASLRSSVAELQQSVSQTTADLSAAQQELTEAARALENAVASEKRAKADSAKLMEDNVTLIDQVQVLTDGISRLEAEHRSTKSALALQTSALAAAKARSGAAPQTSSRKTASSFSEASAWGSRH